MKKFNVLRSTLAALSLAFLSACSTSQYSFAPGTGSYHETIAKRSTELKAEPLALAEATAETDPSTTEIITSPKAEAASALAQTLSANNNLQASETAISSETKSDKKAAREAVKKIKNDLKKLKKKVKDSKASGISSSVKLLLILGLVFIVLGLLLGHILYVIGVILLVIALILLLMDIL